jgi:hypothetical protein
MASITIRNIEDALKSRLRIQAAFHGRAPGRGIAVGPRLIRVDQAATPGSLMMGSLLMGARLSRLM